VQVAARAMQQAVIHYWRPGGERCDLDLPRSARRICEQQPFEKSPDAKPGLELMVWHNGHDYSNNAPLGMAVLPLDRRLPAVGLACARREEGKGTSLIRLPSKR
jgi:hypothetical protein